MTGRILKFDPNVHRAVDALLPWLVNGTLDDDERKVVLAHLETCAQCRREVEWLRDLQSACAATVAPDAPDGLRKLRHALETRSTNLRLPAPLREAWLRSNGWMRAAAVASMVIVAGLAALSVVRERAEPALYHTLGASSAAGGGALAVIFEPATPEAELRRIVHEVGARIVDGPTQANAYLLDVPAERRREAMLALQRERAVAFVARMDAKDNP